MDERKVSNYLAKKIEGTNITYEQIAKISGVSLSTVKNLFTGKTQDPRLDTVAPVTYAVNGSVDEMLRGDLEAVKPTAPKVISEQHFNDTVNHYEHRLEDKREIIKDKNKLIKILTVGICACLFVLVGLLILEVLHPQSGWIRF